MLGYVDYVAGGKISGWAFDPSQPKTRLTVEIIAGTKKIGDVVANSYRPDLQSAGIGDGFHAFSFDIDEDTRSRFKLSVKVCDTDFVLTDGIRNREQQHLESFTQSVILGIPVFPFAFSKSTQNDETDISIASDVIEFWEKQNFNHNTGSESIWTIHFRQNQKDLVDLLDARSRSEIADFFKTSPTRRITYGFLQGDIAYSHLITTTDAGRGHAAAQHVDPLLALGQSVGVLSLESPEQGDLGGNLTKSDPAFVLGEIQKKTGLDLTPPAAFDGLFGALIAGHVYTRRHFQAADAALALRSAPFGLASSSICEIGGGAGFLAIYALRLGVYRYTLVDLPGICLQQYYLLKRSLPGKRISLGADPDADVQIISADTFSDSKVGPFDCVVNVDSFPEMGDAICRSYFDQIAIKAKFMLSINQENAAPLTHDRNGPKQVVVSRLLDEDPRYRRLYRFRNWVRKGYAQELYEIVSLSIPEQ
jgi:hypothetical protein